MVNSEWSRQAVSHDVEIGLTAERSQGYVLLTKEGVWTLQVQLF